MNKLATREYDTIVIGAGLAGLSAGLFLQRQGQSVLLLEKRAAVGGLCGTAMVDGYEFAIGCNDFGQGLVKMVNELEVPVRFKPSKAVICYRNQRLQFPLNLPTILKLLPDGVDFFRFARSFRRMKRDGISKTLAELISEAVRTKRAADILGFLAFAACIPPAQLGMEFIDHEKMYRYGYARPMTPEGGPRSLAEALSNKFLERGEFLLSTEVFEIREHDYEVTVHTNHGDFCAQHVISTTSRDCKSPIGAKAGLAVSLLLLAVKKEFRYPDVHSMTHYPPGIDRWFSLLDDGEIPDDFAFNMVRTELPRAREYHSVTIYFFLPRGMDSTQQAERQYAENYISHHVERMLPGISKNVVYRRLIDPLEYRMRFSLCSKAMNHISPPGYRRKRNSNQARIQYAGHSEFPPGDHAGAAFLSGRYAAQDVLEKMGLKIPSAECKVVF